VRQIRGNRIWLAFIAATSLLLIGNCIPGAEALEDLTPCQLEVPSTSNHIRIGWPHDANILKPIGNVNILVLALDFSDAPMLGNPTNEYRSLMQLSKVSDFYESVSNGLFKPNFYVYPAYLRMPETSTHYGEVLETDELVNGEWESHHMTHDALKLVDGLVDLSQYEGAIVVVSGGASLSGRVALATSQDEGKDVHKTGDIHNTVLAGIRSFAEAGIVPWRIIVHELNHLMGIADLYLYSLDGWWQGKSPGAFGQQGFLRGSSQSDSLAWNRWLTNWIPDSRISCFANPQEISNLPMSQPGVKDKRKEMAVIRLSDRTAIVVEALKTRGFEAASKKNSMLVYLVDTSIKPGFGPVQIIPKKGPITTAPLNPSLPDWDRYVDAPITPGQSITYQNLLIKNNKLINGQMSLSVQVKTGPVKTEG
jgi:M6 family metalloprotease-like protein